MSGLTSHKPKCLVGLSTGETILSRQLRQLEEAGIAQVIITTGYKADMIEIACERHRHNLNISFVHNPDYQITNYIYSLFLAQKLLHDDILLLHGDLVFDDRMITDMLLTTQSCMTVSSTKPLPSKDFKAILKNDRVYRVSVNDFNNAIFAQPLYKLFQPDWELWLGEIIQFCESGIRNCYAEEAFNRLSDKIMVYTFDIKDRLCTEIDTLEDLNTANTELRGQ